MPSLSSHSTESPGSAGRPCVDGVVLPFWFDRPPREALGIADLAEQLGYGNLWIGEMATFDAFALGAAIAGRTRRIRLQLGPLALGVRSPVALALGASSVSEIGGRPAELALGASSPHIVRDWHGAEWSRLPKRLEETVAALRPLLRGERNDHQGETVRTRGFRLRTALPAARITAAALGPQMLRAAASCADRLVLNLLGADQIARLQVTFEQHVRKAGRQRVPVAAWVPAGLDPDERALDQLRAQLAIYLAPPGYGELLSELGFGDLVRAARDGERLSALAPRISRELLDQVALLGTASELRSGVERYRAAGVDHLAIVPLTAHDARGQHLLEALA